MTVEEILEVHPQPTVLQRDVLVRCIEACLDSGASCTACADASLSESDLNELLQVVRLALDCSDVCDATRRVVTRQSAPGTRLVPAQIEACRTACVDCAEECERHAAHHEHCRLCAESCRRCEKACDELLTALGQRA